MGSDPEPTDFSRNPSLQTPQRLIERWVLQKSCSCDPLYLYQVLPGTQRIRPSLMNIVQVILRNQLTSVCSLFVCFITLKLDRHPTSNFSQCFHYSKSGRSPSNLRDFHLHNSSCWSSWDVLLSPFNFSSHHEVPRAPGRCGIPFKHIWAAMTWVFCSFFLLLNGWSCGCAIK